jgi:signal transduction histidine kinase
MKPNATWRKASEWALARFTVPPPLPKPQALFFIVAMLVSIGLADYASGIRISLAVFYLVPTLLAVAWFGWEVAVAVVLASVCIRIVGDFISSGEQSLPLWIWWNSSSSVVVFLFIVWIFSNLLGLFRQLEERVTERTLALLEAVDHRSRLQHELLTVSSNERNSMGQELHDDICQHLVGTTLAARVLAQKLIQQNNGLANEAKAIIALIEEGTGKTRQLARGLLLSAIEPDRLPEKLSELADEGSRSGVTCTFRQAGDVLVADADTAAQLYRIAQEAMRNAIRHAEAAHVDISLVGDEHAICLTVEDDGRGLPESEARSGMGLPIMSHRAEYIGATLSLIATASRGTRLICHLPASAAST